MTRTKRKGRWLWCPAKGCGKQVRFINHQRDKKWECTVCNTNFTREELDELN